MRTLPSFSFVIVLGCASPAAMQGAQGPEPDLARLVAALRDGPAGPRDAAIAGVVRCGPAAVPAIGVLLAQPGGGDEASTLRVAAATRALWRLTDATTALDRAARTALAKALLDLAEAEPPLPQQAGGELLRMVGLVAVDNGSVARLGVHLDRDDHRDGALWALQQIPGDAADRLVLERLADPGKAPRAAFVKIAGARRIGRAYPPLARLLNSAPPEELPAIRAALAECQDASAGAIMNNAVVRDLPGAAVDYLRWYQLHAASGGSAVPYHHVWRQLLRHEAADVRAAAAAALAGNAEDLPGLIAALGDADAAVRHAAREALAADTNADAALFAAHPEASPAVRAGILLALADRHHARALELAREDLAHEAATVRCAAVEVIALTGEAEDEDEDALFTAAGDEDGAVRAAAARGLSSCATRRQQEGDRDGALRLLHRMLAAGGDIELLRDAIARTGRLGAAESLVALEPLAGEASLREHVLEARLQIARALPEAGKAQAIAVLQDTFAATNNKNRRNQALQLLQRHGVDTAPLLRARGFVARWHVLGPWPGAGSKAELGTHPFGDQPPDLQAAVAQGDRQLRWQLRTTEDADGLVDLGFLKPRDNVSAFAFCTLQVPAATDATLALGSDDGVALWLDGKLVHNHQVARGVTVDEDKVQVHLHEGPNTILLRIDQGAGDFGFCLRVLGPDGKPLLLQQVH
ncbi:MAG: hypothetical protein FJ265_09900 [Planctomycetes bacterium]|nr:hypothetical protein [Planctomycetota bacterium]